MLSSGRTFYCSRFIGTLPLAVLALVFLPGRELNAEPSTTIVGDHLPDVSEAKPDLDARLVEAEQAYESAGELEGAERKARLSEVWALLQSIVTDNPESDVAVRILLGEPVGKIDVAALQRELAEPVPEKASPVAEVVVEEALAPATQEGSSDDAINYAELAEPDLPAALMQALDACFLDERALARVGSEAFVKLAFGLGPGGEIVAGPDLIEPRRANPGERRLLRLGSEAITECFEADPGPRKIQVLATFRKSGVEVEIQDISIVAPPPEEPERPAVATPSIEAVPERAEETSPAAPAPAETSASRPDLLSLLAQGISGPVNQPGSRPYSVRIARNDVGITVTYPELDCSGVLELVSVDAGAVTFRERLSRSRGCVNNGWVVLAVAADGRVNFRWSRREEGPSEATALLQASVAPATAEEAVVPEDGPSRLVPIAGDPEDNEKQLRLSRRDRREIQQRLKLAGHDPRGIDGVFGPATRAAIRSWQTSMSVPASGFIDERQKQALEGQTEEAYAELVKRLARERTQRRATETRSGRYIDRNGCLREANGRVVPNFKLGCR